MQVDLPNLSVTEANPAAWLDFYRYSSDKVVQFNAMQVIAPMRTVETSSRLSQAAILRELSPGRFLTTNLMGFFFHFDAYAVADDLEFASWVSIKVSCGVDLWLSLRVCDALMRIL